MMNETKKYLARKKKASKTSKNAKMKIQPILVAKHTFLEIGKKRIFLFGCMKQKISS